MSYLNGLIIRCPETQCQVVYPKDTHHPPFVPGRNGLFEDWSTGLNRTNDVYKPLELAIMRLRTRKQKKPAPLSCESIEPELHTKLDELQMSIPYDFTQVYERSADSGGNRCGFQTISIMGAVCVARVVSGLAQGHELDSILPFAAYMVSSIRAVPVEYLRAVGPSLLQNLHGVALFLCRLAMRQHAAPDTSHSVAGLLESIVTLFKSLRLQGDESVCSIERLVTHLNTQAAIPESRNFDFPLHNQHDHGRVWTADDLAVDFGAFLDACGQSPSGAELRDLLHV